MDLTLPDGANTGDGGHIADHNLIVAAIEALNDGKIDTLTIGSVNTVSSDAQAQASLTQTGPGSYSLSLVVPRGAIGEQGDPGSPGAQGDPGAGMPTGGATGQYVKKNSNSDYDYTFGTPTASEVGAVPTSRLVSAGTGLTGGGALSQDVYLAVRFGSTSGTSVEGTHIGAADPHPGYATDAELVAAIAAHEGAANPHPGLIADVASLTSDVASLTTDVAAAAAAAQAVADALADLPTATGDVVTVRHDPDADAWYDADGAVVTVRPSTPAWPRANVVWDSSLSPSVTSPPALAVRGDVWFPHGSVDPTA